MGYKLAVLFAAAPENDIVAPYLGRMICPIDSMIIKIAKIMKDIIFYQVKDDPGNS